MSQGNQRLNLSAYTKGAKLGCHFLLPVWMDLNYSLCFPLHFLDAIKCHKIENYNLYC